MREFIAVGGVPRSGTSLVQKMLDLHTEVYGGPELGILPQLMGTYRHVSRSITEGKLSVVLDHERARRSYRDFVWSLYEDRLARKGCRYLSEKTPFNLLAFDLLAEVFPTGRFVWVIRDPRDVLSSMQAVHARGQEVGDTSVSVGRSVHRDLRLIRRYLEAGEAFARSHGERLHVIHYEELLSDPRRIAMGLCAFLDLEFEDAMLATQQSNDTSAALGEERKRQSVFYDLAMFDRPIDRSNMGKWRSELDARSVHAVEVYLGTNPLPCLQRYEIGRPGPLWSTWAAVAAPASELGDAVLRRVRRRRRR